MTTHHIGQEANRRNQESQPRWFVLPTLALVWFGMVGIGLSSMWQYEITPGESADSPLQWPADTLMERSTNRPTLVMFAHPRCPCTRASMGELALIMAHYADQVDVSVLFFKPSKFSNDWDKTDLWSSAKAITGVTVLSDEDGNEANRFRATTSGHTLLYDSHGQLLFQGGITGSRGHSGDNAGRSAIESLLKNGDTKYQQRTFVFGCPLQGPDETCVTETHK